MRLTSLISSITLAAMLAFSANAQAQAGKKEAKRKPIDPATIAGWKKLGATYQVKIARYFPEWDYAPKSLPIDNDLPGFTFWDIPKLKPPDVEVPFGLDLYHSQVKDADLKLLASIKNLTVLTLRETQITDAGVKDLALFSDLSALSLGRTKVTGAGLGKLPSRLAFLDLSGSLVSDDSLKELVALKDLRILSLRNTKVSDAGIKEINKLKKLMSLCLDETEITDAGLKELRTFTDLRELSLNATKVTDAGMKAVGSLERLESLYLAGTAISDDGLKEIAGLKKLTVLSLFQTKVSVKGLKHLAPLKNLQFLDVGLTKIDDDLLRILREIDLLHVIETATKEEEISSLFANRPTSANEVLFLNLSATDVTDKGLKELVGLKNLRSLTLNGENVTKAGVAELQKSLPKCKISH